MKKPILLSIFSALVICGCSTTKTTPIAPPLALADKDWLGTWTGAEKSFFGFDSTQALILEPGGLGSILTSDIFNPQKGEHWIAITSLSWEIVSPSLVNLTLLETKTLHGDGRWGVGTKKKGVFPLTSTQSGLRTEILGLSNARFQRVSNRPDQRIASKIIAEVQQSMQSQQMAGGNGNSGNKNAGLFLAGAGLGAAASGNLEMGQQLMNQAAATYSGVTPRNVDQIGGYDRNNYFTGGNGKAKESLGQATGTEAQLREAYPDGQAWDVQALNGTIWKVYYGAPTSIKNQMIASGNLVTASGRDQRNKVLRGPYKPYLGMKIGLVAIDPP